MRFKLSAIFLVIILLVCSAFAQEVNLTGTVLKDSIPVNGVVATLTGLGLSDTTGPDGIYHLVDGTEINVPQVNSFKNEWKNSMFLFLITGDKCVSIDIFSLKGQITTIFNEKLLSGRHSIMPGISNMAAGIYVINLKVGGKTLLIHKIFHLGGQKSTVHTRLGDGCRDVTFVASSRGQSDTLVLFKDGQMISVEILDTLVGMLPAVSIAQINVNGKFTITSDSISKVEGIFTGDNIPDSLYKTFGFAGGNKYSGYIFSLLGTVKNYKVFVRVYDGVGRLIGQSNPPTPFNNLFGSVQVDSFNVENAKPVVSLGNDTTVSIYDTIYFKAVVVDSFRIREIMKWEWDFGNGFNEGSEDTIIVAPDSVNRAQIVTIIKVTDVHDNTAIDTNTVTVVQDIPVVKANVITPDTVWVGDYAELKGTAVDLYGKIVKWEWNIGNGFVESSSGDTVLEIPYYGDNKFILRATDDDSNVVCDTVVITIFGTVDQMSFIPAKNRKVEINFDPLGYTATFTYNFLMDTTEVTQADYDAIMNSIFSMNNFPINNIDWFDAVLYCNARSKLDGFDTVYIYTAIEGVSGDSTHNLVDLSFDIYKNGYRLPTETEWLFACWGLMDPSDWQSGFPWTNGGDSAVADDYMWWNNNSGGHVNLVGKKFSNNFRLYDMLGNAEEWLNDWYEEECSAVNPLVDYIGPVSSKIGKVTKGGSCMSEELLDLCPRYRIAHGIALYEKNNIIGFRTVRTID